MGRGQIDTLIELEGVKYYEAAGGTSCNPARDRKDVHAYRAKE